MWLLNIIHLASRYSVCRRPNFGLISIVSSVTKFLVRSTNLSFPRNFVFHE